MEHVIAPPRCRVWEKDGWWLYFDPHNFAWVRVNQHGRYLLEQLRRYRTVSQIAEQLEREFGVAAGESRGIVESFAARLIKAGFLHDDEYREQPRARDIQRPFASDVYLHMTNECNLKCPYCYNKDDRNEKLDLVKRGDLSPILGTDEYKHLIRRLIEEGARRLLFTGGEPLMRPDVLELAEHARSLSADVKLEILTNGILIKENNVERICRLFTAVTVSLDGHEAHLHEFYRGRNTFAPTVAGVRRLVAERARLGQSSPYLSIVPALTEKNIGLMKEIFEFAIDGLGANGLAPIIFQAGDHQELSISQIPPLHQYEQEMARTLTYLEKRAAARAVQAGGQGSDDGRASGNGAGAPAKRPVVLPRFDCGVGNGEISVDPSGTVYPCQSLHFDEFVCGSVREQDIKTIFDESPVMRRVRGLKVNDLSVCSHCDLKHLCNGGCRATAYNVYRDFEAHNEIYCRHLEHIAVNRMWGTSGIPLSEIEYACSTP
jgi:radical SAM protein with 4Fe4S-binding SPASM domain